MFFFCYKHNTWIAIETKEKRSKAAPITWEIVVVVVFFWCCWSKSKFFHQKKFLLFFCFSFILMDWWSDLIIHVRVLSDDFFCCSMISPEWWWINIKQHTNQDNINFNRQRNYCLVFASDVAAVFVIRYDTIQIQWFMCHRQMFIITKKNKKFCGSHITNKRKYGANVKKNNVKCCCYC